MAARGCGRHRASAKGLTRLRRGEIASVSEQLEDGLEHSQEACTVDRRQAAVAAIAACALCVPRAPVLAEGSSSLAWVPTETLPDDNVEEVFKLIESDREWNLDFIVYLSRILINYDKESARWWNQEIVPSVPQAWSPSLRAAALRQRFAQFVASVEFGLRRYIAGRFGPMRRTDLLNKLVADYGQSAEGRRQLAFLFTLLQDQPRELISKLLEKTSTQERLLAAFSPALTDYLAMDPARLLPPTQWPVWDGGQRRWVVRGLQNATPYPNNGDPDESVFGPRGESIVSKERRLSERDFLLFALSGALGCSGTHSLVVPVDVVKTRLQTDPGRYANLLEGIQEMQRTEGWGALFLGLEPTVLGYFWYGVTVYPGYEFFKRLFLELAGPAIVSSFRVPLVLLAGACATVIACFGVCPAEACRIRMVADSSLKGKGIFEVVQIINEKDGAGYFYDGLGTILIRQVLFGMMKFLVFDYFADFVLDIFPVLAEKVETQLAVSLLSGAVAGVVSSIVSQPADTVLSKINKEGGRKGLLEVGGDIYRTEGFAGFFQGLGARCVWAGCIISGQFFLYDVCKSFLGVKDLRIFLDVQV